jgi:glycosyltransferase involved in cell wall biosynthesis
MKLFYPGQRGGPFGWGVFGREMTRALDPHFKLMDNPLDAEVCFMPIADHQLAPSTSDRCRWNVGMCFFEYPLGEKAVENAKQYDHIFCGSTWCLDRLWERGITNAEVLIQGVDHSIFRPREPHVNDYLAGRPFRIFSGGKFEWRKGQDLVIRAFAEFAKRHPDAHLVCLWFNPWPGLVVAGARCMMLDVPKGSYLNQEALYADMLKLAGIPRDRFTILPQLDQASLAREMQNTDVGLFPNRCEGGTNLVLMEYSACGKPIVANTLTGHADVRHAIEFEIPAREDDNKWAEMKVEDIVEAMETAYRLRDNRTPRLLGNGWTWQAAAEKVAAAVARLSETG